MSEKKFQFISPGVFVEEIDRSFLDDETTARGPIVIGRSEKGPSMEPVRITSFNDFVNTFGNPIPGGRAGDVWRDGNYTSPTYAAYAAQAYLRNNAPVTFVRLVGSKHVSATTTGTPGYDLGDYAIDGFYMGGGGAQGLFIFDSGSAGTPVSGTLAAVWYMNTPSGAIELVGNQYGEVATEVSGAGVLVESVGAAGEVKFKALIRDGASNVVDTTTFDFTPGSNNFIRKVFNTNPTLTDTANNGSDEQQTYWLGQTFEGNLLENDNEQGILDSAVKYCGAILPLASYDNTKSGADFKKDSERASTGWFFHQDFGATGSFVPSDNSRRLFRLHSRAKDGWASKNLKISISNLKYSNNEFDKWGTFTVEVRSARDTDADKVVIERFENVSLNPNSSDFISQKIGDQRVQWDETTRRNRTLGLYPNNSKYIYVETTDAVREGTINERALPAGFFGPPRYNGWATISGSANTFAPDGTYGTTNTDDVFVTGGGNVVGGDSNTFIRCATGFTGSVEYPKVNLRQTSNDTNLSDPRDAYFGLETRTQEGGKLFQESYLDLGLTYPNETSTRTSTSLYFTLDDLSASGPIAATDRFVTAVYSSGSRANGTSLTAVGATLTALASPNFEASLKGLIELGYDSFTAPIFGGFDGFDVRNREPMANRLMTGMSTETTDYVFNTFRRAIDIVQDSEGLDVNLAAVPGLTQETLTQRLVDNCAERGDVLAIIDLEGGYIPRAERTDDNYGESDGNNLGDVENTINSLKDRNINSSYGCAYYPWVLARDTATTGQSVWLPPSVVALGVMGNSATESELWFAPAGFNRGGLTEGDSGLNVVAVRERLSSKDRDRLYEQNINPIATFPAEGIVIFGQKTLQLTRSALDRINVRRLMIFLKKEISFAASRVLFDQNVEETWARFTAQVKPLLQDVQARFGLTDYKLVLDNTTTTPELIDRNIMYAKIFVKPARAIEYIALDFIITATGASFEE